MNISEIQLTYNRLWNQACQSIETNSMRVDTNLLEKAKDLRRGITLICRPSRCVQEKITKFLKEMQQIEPNQYYYAAPELHTTILSIITCNVDFELNEIDIAPYIEVLTRSVASISPFSISYRGITASPDCVMIQGFPQGVILEELRQSIRDNFKNSGIKSTLDARYKTHTAHITCSRIQESPLKKPDEFLQTLSKYKDFDFGTSEITEVEFVVNDWYMSNENTEILYRFSLNNK